MPFNGSGTFTRVYNWVNDKAGGIPITASRVDTEDTGFATGLTNVICKDGQTTITANLPMSSFRHTGVGNAQARTDYSSAGQIQDGGLTWIASGGTADVITATYSPAITALVDGMELGFRATAANATTTPTFSPNGLTARTITKKGGSALVANDIAGAAFEAKLRYNLANTRWELMNPAVIAPATNTVTNTMLSQMGAFSIKSNITGSTANAADNTLSNIIDAAVGNTQGSLIIRSTSGWIIYTYGTPGQFLKTQGIGADPVWTTIPFTKSFESTQQTITSAGALTLAHGMATRPLWVFSELVCQSSEFGFTTGDRVPVYLTAAGVGASALGASIVYDATNVNLRFSSNGTVFSVPNFGTGANAGLTNANWKLIVRAYA